MLNVFTAKQQWSSRPIDERFENSSDMLTAAIEVRQASKTAKVQFNALCFDTTGGDLSVTGLTGRSARLSEYAMGYLCADLGAPKSYLQRLPALLAADCLNEGLRGTGDDEERELLLLDRGDDGLLLRGTSSPNVYKRVWNTEMIQAVQRLEERGWRVPPAWPAQRDPRARQATQADVARLGEWATKVRVGDMIAPAGLYLGDRDMFAFLVDPTRPIDGGNGLPLMRGIMVSGSEVAGASRLELATFLLNTACGNHNLLGVHEFKAFSAQHTGKAWDGFQSACSKANDWRTASPQQLEAHIRASQAFLLGDTNEAVEDNLFGRRMMPRSLVQEALASAEANPQELGGASPRSAWGVAQGLTRVAQVEPYADKRQAIDVIAGRVLGMAF